MYKDESELFELSADMSSEDTMSKLDEAAESLEISSLELDVIFIRFQLSKQIISSRFFSLKERLGEL
jgi:hypothetical protein